MSVLDKIRDPYERKARVTPALIVLLPFLVPLVLVYGPKSSLLTGLAGLFLSCGVLFTLANIVRGYGKKLEFQLIKKWGGLPTTISLRHRDTFFDPLTKARYHSAIEAKLNIKMPTHEEEMENPIKIDGIYEGACRLLREKTRINNHLLIQENINYGFNRNMVAVKNLGIFTSLLGLMLSIHMLGLINWNYSNTGFNSTMTADFTSLITLLISLITLFFWLFFFNFNSVRQIGFCYAERLFEALENLPKT